MPGKIGLALAERLNRLGITKPSRLRFFLPTNLPKMRFARYQPTGREVTGRLRSQRCV